MQSAAAHAGVSFKEAQARLAAGEGAEMSDDDDDECGPTHTLEALRAHAASSPSSAWRILKGLQPAVWSEIRAG